MKCKNHSLLFFTVLFSFLLCFHSGCAVFLLGAGAAGGYAISKDEIEGHTDTSFKKTFEGLSKVITEEGVVTLQDSEKGYFEGLVNESEIKAYVEQVTPKSVRIRIKARKTKGLFPDIKTAQDLYAKLISKIE